MRRYNPIVLVACLALLGFATSDAVQSQTQQSQLADIRFEGARMVSVDELKAITGKCLSDFGLAAEPSQQREQLDYCLRHTANFIRSKGYLRAEFSGPKTEIISNGTVVTVRLEEGPLYRLGQVTIDGADQVSTKKIREMLPLAQGDVVDAGLISKWLYEDLKEIYGDSGYIQYTAEAIPDFKNSTELDGVVDFKVVIDEGDKFTLRSLILEGDQLPTAKFMNESPLKPGDVYNASAFEAFLDKLNQTSLFEPIDKDRDSEFRVDNEERLVSIRLKLRKRGVH
jgi:outer membrane protein insertion porin family